MLNQFVVPAEKFNKGIDGLRLLAERLWIDGKLFDHTLFTE